MVYFAPALDVPTRAVPPSPSPEVEPILSEFGDVFLEDLPSELLPMRHIDGELSLNKNTRVPSEPRYELRKRNHSQKQQKSILLLIHKFEKLSIHERNEKDLSKTLKESVDSMGIFFPPFPILP